tara:strand:- start:10202 stop:10699 length:498 start_codon:yes stop_codon:yes gene_type:complete
MSAAVWPPIGDAQLAEEQAASQARELEWLLVQLRETLQSLKAGLEECAALLAPSENGSTLVLSSVRSESLKGLITRIGTRITKGVRATTRCCRAVLKCCFRTSSFAWQACPRRADLIPMIWPSRPHRKRLHSSCPSSPRCGRPSTAAWTSSTLQFGAAMPPRPTL